MVARGILLAVVVLLLPVAGQAQTYRWVDSEGNVHYSDTPPPPGARQIEQKQLPTRLGETQTLPYALQQATRNFPVTLFISECGGACTQARQLLIKRGVPHTELDATDPTAQESLSRLTGGSVEVPVLQVGKQVLRGFEQGAWNTALDAAGYPQSALIKVTPRKPPPPKPPDEPTEQVEPEQPAENADLVGVE